MVHAPHHLTGATVTPSIRLQSWGFMIGSALFALGSAPYLARAFGTTGAALVVRTAEGDEHAVWVPNADGSVAFGVSAIASIVTPAGGVRDASVASVATFVGAVCFFAAAAIVLGSDPDGESPPDSTG